MIRLKWKSKGTYHYGEWAKDEPITRAIMENFVQHMSTVDMHYSIENTEY